MSPHNHFLMLLLILTPTLSHSQGMQDADVNFSNPIEKIEYLQRPEVVRQLELLNTAHPRIHALGRGLTQRGIPWTRYLSSPGDDKLFIGYTRAPNDNEFSCLTMSAYSRNLELKNGKERLVPSAISMWIGENPAENILFNDVSHGSISVGNPVTQTQAWISTQDEHGVAVIVTNMAGSCE